MECPHCKKHFDKPLELYNGIWACPKRGCHKDLINVDEKTGKPEINPANDELFNLAEVAYLTALKEEEDKNYKRNLKAAISICRDAVLMNHPKAIMRMAFFYENGYIVDDEVESAVKACMYYKIVFTQDDLKRVAAKRYMALTVKYFPHKIEEAKRLIREYIPDFVAGEEAERGLDAENEILEQLKHIVDFEKIKKERKIKKRFLSRQPLMSFFRLTKKEVIKLLTDEEVKRSVESYTNSGNRMALFKVFDDRERDPEFACNIISGTMKQNGQKVQESEQEDYYLFVFNHNGKHAFSKMAMTKVAKYLEKDEYARVRAIIKVLNDEEKEILSFYDDDIIKYKDDKFPYIESISHATGNLVDAYCKEKNKKSGR